jgi:peptide/nickel transport system substrate-binding protein
MKRRTKRHTNRERCVAIGVALGALTLSCGGRESTTSRGRAGTVLRVGVAQFSMTNPNSGIRQLNQLLSVESLGRLGEDGRVEPQIADKWALTDGGRTLRVTLKPGVKFHDGSVMDADSVAGILPDALRGVAGPVLDDVDHIRAVGADKIEIGFRRPSPLLVESLEVQVRKPGQAIVATGPFMTAAGSTSDLVANPAYYLPAPKIERLTIRNFASIRAAWAELLRNNIDMLYEVGPDALDSLESSTSVSTFRFTRRYQFTIAMNSAASALKPAAIRRALNMAIDRGQLVRQSLNGHGVPSSGPIWPKYWALQDNATPLLFDPGQAAAALGAKNLHFTCLIPADQVYERIGLELKHQLAAIGVEMDLRSTTTDALFEAQKTGNYEAVLMEGISGPTLLRIYQLWHSRGAGNPGKLGNATVDTALDRVRHSETEPEYRLAVTALQDAFRDDPPAIFLSWSERARAVSKRFIVPAPESGRDILGTLRLWTPRNDDQFTNRN